MPATLNAFAGGSAEVTSVYLDNERSAGDIVKNEHFDERPRCSHEALRPLAQVVDLHQEGRPLLEQDSHPSSKTWFLHLPQTKMLLRKERRSPPALDRLPCYLP